MGVAIATPVGALTLLPLLVAAVGLFLTLVGQRALKDSNRAMASDRLEDASSLLARSIGAALEESGPILDRLGPLALEHDSILSYNKVAHNLRDLMQGRAGVAYISISFPDGTFQGAYRDLDGTIRFQDSRVTTEGTLVKRYSLLGHERLEPYLEERSDYDPRKRPFYALAMANTGRVWTEPYPFFKTHFTGITRTQAIHEPGTGALHAVITVDFDVTALSAILSRISAGDATTLLYANDGTVLAYPRGARVIDQLPLRDDRALRYTDLEDPLLSAFFSRRARAQSNPARRPNRLSVGDTSFLLSEQPIATSGELPWSVAVLMPEAVVLSSLHQHQVRSALAAGLATLLACALAWLFARHILRTRLEIAIARAEANEAVARAQELGSYRLVEMLGKGGMGEVWRAEHRLLVRQAAIKLISLGEGAGLSTTEMQERFRREAQSLATLRSRNTIELFDYGVTSAGTCFYVMELLDGMDLETLVERHGPQPAARVILFLIQACNSLAEAHDAGLVHRDIKPANLYICRVADEVDVIKVLDFGLVRAAVNAQSLPPPRPTPEGPESRDVKSGVRRGAADTDLPLATSIRQRDSVVQSADTSEATDGAQADHSAQSAHGTQAAHDSQATRLTQVGQAMGTPAYMAPEQAFGRELDGRADLYSLGCIAFFLLSGQLLFERNGSLAMMMAHITEPLPDFATCIPGYLPPELAAVLRQCLAKDPVDRPANARALAAALKAIRIPPAAQWGEAQAQAWWTKWGPKPQIHEKASGAPQRGVA